MTVNQIILDVSTDLNDQLNGYEYISWSYTQLLSYLKESLGYITEALFDSDSGGVKLYQHETDPSLLWQSVCDCKTITRVSLINSDGTYKTLRLINDDPKMMWTECNPSVCGGGCIDSYIINKNDRSLFRLLPPTSYPVKVAVECYSKQDIDIDLSTDIDKAYIAPIKQWMLYRALSVDSENNQAIFTLAQTHQQTYFSLVKELNQKYITERAYNDRMGQTQDSGYRQPTARD